MLLRCSVLNKLSIGDSPLRQELQLRPCRGTHPTTLLNRKGHRCATPYMQDTVWLNYRFCHASFVASRSAAEYPAKRGTVDPGPAHLT